MTDFRLKALKENRPNLGAINELPKDSELPTLETPDHDLRGRVRQLEVKLSNFVEAQKRDTDGSKTASLKYQSRLDLLEHQLAILGREDARKSNKNEATTQARGSATTLSNLNGEGRRTFKQTIISDLASQKEELRLQKQRQEQFQMRQLRFEQDLRELLPRKRQELKIKLINEREQVHNGLNKQICNSNTIDVNRNIETLSQGLERSLITLKDEWKSLQLEEGKKLDGSKSTTAIDIERSRIERRDRGVQGSECSKGELEQWKKSIEQRISRLLEEVSNSMKGSKMYWRKEHDELAKENQQTAKEVKEFKHTLSKRLEKETNEMTGLLSEQFDAFLQELEHVNELVALAKKEIEVRLAKETSALKEVIKDSCIETQRKMEEVEQGMSRSVEESVKAMRREFSKLQKAVNSQVQRLGLLEESSSKRVTSPGEEEGKALKLIQSLRTEFEGRLKAANDRMLLDMSVKKEFEHKKKDEESHLKATEIDKKLADANLRIKGELKAELSKKIARSVEEELQKPNTQIQAFLATFKAEIEAKIEKSQVTFAQGMERAKIDFERRLKAKEEKNHADYYGKKEAEMKQKLEEHRITLKEMSLQVSMMPAKMRDEISSELNKMRTGQSEDLRKVRTEIEARLKTFEEQRAKKENESKARQLQLRSKESEMKNQSIQFERKIQEAKVQVQDKTRNSIVKLKTELDGKFAAYKQQTQSRVMTLEENLQHLRADSVLHIQEVSKKVESVKVYTQSKCEELLEAGSIRGKRQEQEVGKLEEKKISSLRNELSELINSRVAPAEASIKANSQKMQRIANDTSSMKATFDASLSSHQQLLNKLQANLFSEKQKNKAVYNKMCSDIADIGDSLMVAMSELKPSKN